MVILLVCVHRHLAFLVIAGVGVWLNSGVYLYAVINLDSKSDTETLAS
jgi:hypothetical protein